MSEPNLQSDVDPDERSIEIDQRTHEAIEDAMDNERESDYDGTDDVVDDDPSTMMEHL